MINIVGNATFSFQFPAPPDVALDFYADINRLVACLPYIQLIHSNGNGLHRVQYETVEMGAYTIRILCDVRLTVDKPHRRLHVAPVTTRPAIPGQATLNSTTGRGFYENVIRFAPSETGSQVEMRLKLTADLPRPHSMKFMPRQAVRKLTQGITQNRIREISHNFVAQSVADYPAKPQV